MGDSVRRAGVVALLAAVLATTAGIGALADRAGDVRVEAFNLLNRGVTAYNRGDYGEAVEHLRRASNMALNSFRAYFYLGLALVGDRRYDDAVEALIVALDLDPTHLRAHVALGDAHLGQGDTDEAMAANYRALKLRPDYAPALDGIARVHEARGDEQEAMSFFRQAIAANKGFADAYTHLGELHLRAGRVDEAVRLLAEAVSIRPDFAPGLNRLALAYARLGLANDAVASIARAIELEPGSPSHRAALGRIQLVMGLPSNAEATFQEALELDPGLPDARRGLAEVERRRGRYAEAIGQVDAALADERVNARTRRELEDFRASIEREWALLAVLLEREAEGLTRPEEYRLLARLFAGREEWDRALELQRKAPGTIEDREALAYLLFQTGRYREAHRHYAELARELARADLWINDGVALALLGDHDGALEAYGRALAIEADDPRATLYRANALMRLGRRDEAVEAYVRFLKRGGTGAAEERVRRILEQIAPESAPRKPLPFELPPEPPAPEAAS